MWKVHPATVSHIGSWQEGSASGRMGRAGAVLYLNTNLDLKKYEDEEEHGVGVHNRKINIFEESIVAGKIPPHPPPYYI